MDRNDKIEGAIEKLTELTRTGALQWRRTAPQGKLVENSDLRVEAVYKTNYGRKGIRAYEARIRNRFGPEWDDVTWHDLACLEFMDAEDHVIWEFPSSYGYQIWPLLKAIQYQEGDVDVLLENIVNGVVPDASQVNGA